MTSNVGAAADVGRDTKLTIGVMARALLWVVYAWLLVNLALLAKLEDREMLRRQLQLEQELRARSVQPPSNVWEQPAN